MPAHGGSANSQVLRCVSRTWQDLGSGSAVVRGLLVPPLPPNFSIPSLPLLDHPSPPRHLHVEEGIDRWGHSDM